MKIHLVTLIAADLDYDIIDFWIEHYKKLELDSYTAFVHYEQSKKHPEVREKLEASGFKTKYAFGDYGRATLRLNIMNGFSSRVPSDEYILSVDSDEFQQWPRGDIRFALGENLLDSFNGQLIDSFNGQLVDCYDVELKEAVKDIPLRLQYPFQYIDLEVKLNKNTVCRLSNKICVARSKVAVDFKGSHDVSTLHSCGGVGFYSKRGTLKILHYKWRKTLKERWLGKKAYTEEQIDEMMAKANALKPE